MPPLAPAPDRIARAIGCRLAAMLGFSAMGALIKLAEGDGAGLAEILFFRQAGALPVVIAYVAAGPGLASIATARIGAHALRAAIGLVAMACMFATLLMLPLAEATAIQFTLPIFATLLGALVLREPTGVHRWGAVIVGFAGVIIVTQPGSGHIPLLGAVIGLAAALLSAVVSILLRRIGRTESASTTVFWFSALTAPLLLGFYLFDLRAHSAFGWIMLVAIGLTGGVAQLFMTESLRVGAVGLVVPIDYSSLIWATLFGWLLFGALPTPWTWAGAPIIIGSGLYIAWREHRLARAITPPNATAS